MEVIGYRLKHPNSNRHYIGITTQPCRQRLSKHLADKHKNKKVCWILSHIEEKHLFYMEPFFRVNNLELAKKLEIYWIADDRRVFGYDNIMNNTDGGEGTTGRVITEETRVKMSEAQKGKTSPRKGVVLSLEIRKKISESNKGRLGTRKGAVVTEDTKIKQSKAKKGKPLKFETKQKLRKLNKQQVQEVFELLKSGMYQHDVAKKFNISKQNVSLINLGKTYQEFQYLKEQLSGVV